MKFFADLLTNRSCNTRGGRQASLSFGYVEIGFIERKRLNQISVKSEYLAGRARSGFIADEVGRHKDCIGAQSFGMNRRHRRAHTKLPCFVRSRAHNRTITLPCNHDGSTAQSLIVTLLDGSVERVHIDMNDLSKCGRSAHELPGSEILMIRQIAHYMERAELRSAQP